MYKDVRLLSKETFINGKRNGETTSYWPGIGKVRSTGHYVGGLKDGSWDYYDYMDLKPNYVKTDLYSNGTKVSGYSEVAI